MNYRTLIWLGFSLFVGGFIADSFAIPILYHAILIGPIIFFIGIVIWIPKRLRNPILDPYNPKKYRSIMDAVLAFMFNNFLLEFWGFCVAFAMSIVIISSIGIRSSTSFKAAKEKLRLNAELKSEIGVIHSYGYLIAGSIGYKTSKLTFSVYEILKGERVSIDLEKEGREWKVLSMEVK